jgi:hypothetical protein
LATLLTKMLVSISAQNATKAACSAAFNFWVLVYDE